MNNSLILFFYVLILRKQHYNQMYIYGCKALLRNVIEDVIFLDILCAFDLKVCKKC